MKDQYTQRIVNFNEKLAIVLSREQRIAIARAIFFVSAVGLLIAFVKTNWIFGILIPGCLMVGFIWLVQSSARLKSKLIHLRNLVQINKDELLALDGNLDPFKTGSEYQDYHHAYSYDLDIFGEYSLYRLLDRTGTVPGKDRLAEELLHPEQDRQKILNRQQAVQELSINVDWRQDFLATARQIEFEKDETRELKNWLKGKDHFSGNRIYPILFILVPIISVAIPALIAFKFLSIYAGLYYIFPLALVAFQAKRILREQSRLGRFVKLFKKYSGLLLLIEKEDFISDLLRDEQDVLIHKELMASKIVNRLSGILWGIESRNNLIMAILLNAFVIWDIRYMVNLEIWRRDFGDAFEDWLNVIARVEVLNSLANLTHNRDDLVFPELSEGNLKLEMIEGGHPFLNPGVRVDNSLNFTAPGQIKIITGANMAGKSTLLRTVGVNLVLALLGAPVCAKKFTFTPVRIRTSVRTNDSLGDNESYFYAELVKLNRIMTELREKGPIVVIVDEMLKGTNSRDKHMGSVGLVKQLVELGAIGLVATHDVELGQLVNTYPDHIENKCFEVDITGEQLSFDYRLRDGISKNLNATFLMKQMGILKNDKNED